MEGAGVDLPGPNVPAGFMFTRPRNVQPGPSPEVEDAGETLLSFYDLDVDRDFEATEASVGQQAPRVKVDADFFNRFPDDFDEDDMRPLARPS
ncbi:hypothetical protein WJX81_004336 [Elliptochloris bilobata]|uniref:Uncharacterized protein n=1 Tax=Elliptochloris bilobata TaxID=381761 RepID=A0AAW1S209_9CHLO